MDTVLAPGLPAEQHPDTQPEVLPASTYRVTLPGVTAFAQRFLHHVLLDGLAPELLAMLQGDAVTAEGLATLKHFYLWKYLTRGWQDLGLQTAPADEVQHQALVNELAATLVQVLPHAATPVPLDRSSAALPLVLFTAYDSTTGEFSAMLNPSVILFLPAILAHLTSAAR